MAPIELILAIIELLLIVALILIMMLLVVLICNYIQPREQKQKNQKGEEEQGSGKMQTVHPVREE